MNRVFLLGRADHTPEVRATREGRLITNFTLSTLERIAQPDGTDKPQTEWHNVVAYGECADHARTSVKRGQPVLIEGRIRTVSWPDKRGGDRRHRTEVIVTAFHPISTLRDLFPNAAEEDLAPE